MSGGSYGQTGHPLIAPPAALPDDARMSANESLVTTPVKAADPKTAKEWLDALCAGTCDQETYLRAVTELSRKTPDACWEVLSLLDQYYRRGKIAFELFQKLESHLQSVAVRAETKAGAEFSVPLPAQSPASRDKTPRIAPMPPRPTPPPPASAPPRPAPATAPRATPTTRPRRRSTSRRTSTCRSLPTTSRTSCATPTAR